MNVREWALPVYTILMQLSVGTLLVLWIVRGVHLRRFADMEINRIVKFPIMIIFATICLAMIGSHSHLSRPFHSYLAVLNFRRSWLSREIVFTVLFFLTTGSLASLHWLQEGKTKLKTFLGWLAIMFGLIVIFCMSHIYLLPTQPAWNSPFTVLSFYLTMLLLGCIALPAMLLIDFSFSNVLTLERFDQQYLLIRRILIWSSTAGIIAWLVVAALNLYQMLILRLGDQWAQVSFELLTNLYRPLLLLRLVLPLVGITILAVSVFNAARQNRTVKELMIPVYAACIFVMVGEILGRFLFYATHIRIGV